MANNRPKLVALYINCNYIYILNVVLDDCYIYIILLSISTQWDVLYQNSQYFHYTDCATTASKYKVLRYTNINVMSSIHVTRYSRTVSDIFLKITWTFTNDRKGNLIKAQNTVLRIKKVVSVTVLLYE